jgi:hypothetical protein
MEKLDQILRQYNPYYNSYKRMYEVEKEEEEKAKANGTTITQVTINNLTMLQFYSYALAFRNKTFSLLHSARKLFHQYIVDAYTKIEANRLKYLREHQNELRADLYLGLFDYVNDNREGLIGRKTILPSSFIVSIF